MKATQSSLYRELENLMLWFIPVGNNIPKDFALRKLGERMQNDILDAMTACNLALQTQDLHQRMELISLMKLHITSVQNISRVLVEFSSREGNVKRVISLRQRDALLQAGGEEEMPVLAGCRRTGTLGMLVQFVHGVPGSSRIVWIAKADVRKDEMVLEMHLPLRRIQTGEAEKQVSTGNGFSKKEY